MTKKEQKQLEALIEKIEALEKKIDAMSLNWHPYPVWIERDSPWPWYGWPSGSESYPGRGGSLTTDSIRMIDINSPSFEIDDSYCF